jgi:hypothetical protein
MFGRAFGTRAACTLTRIAIAHTFYRTHTENTLDYDMGTSQHRTDEVAAETRKISQKSDRSIVKCPYVIHPVAN